MDNVTEGMIDCIMPSVQILCVKVSYWGAHSGMPSTIMYFKVLYEQSEDASTGPRFKKFYRSLCFDV